MNRFTVEDKDMRCLGEKDVFVDFSEEEKFQFEGLKPTPKALEDELLYEYYYSA